MKGQAQTRTPLLGTPREGRTESWQNIGLLRVISSLPLTPEQGFPSVEAKPSQPRSMPNPKVLEGSLPPPAPLPQLWPLWPDGGGLGRALALLT